MNYICRATPVQECLSEYPLSGRSVRKSALTPQVSDTAVSPSASQSDCVSLLSASLTLQLCLSPPSIFNTILIQYIGGMKSTYIGFILLSLACLLLFIYLNLHDESDFIYSVSTLSSKKCQNSDIVLNSKSLTRAYGRSFHQQYHYNLHGHSVTEDVQILFNQALLHLYGYNRIEANRNIKAAIEEDPQCGMCYWVLAYCNAPNINTEITEQNVVDGRLAIDKAYELSTRNKEEYTDLEKLLVLAFRTRFTDDINKWRVNNQSFYDMEYSKFMKNVHEKFPQNIDVLVLYADSILILTPWNYYERDKVTPKLEMQTALLLLEQALELSNHSHPLALHLYIHVTEQSLNPANGLKAANSLALLVGNEGTSHLVHMPAHTYMRTGLYLKCIKSSLDAILLDVKYGHLCLSPYVPLHNKALLISCALNNGDKALALRHSFSVSKTCDGFEKYIAGLFPTPKELIYARFGNWNEILALTGNDFLSSFGRELVNTLELPTFMQVVKFYAITLANINLNKLTKSSIEENLVYFSKLVNEIPADTIPSSNPFYPYHQSLGFIMNSTVYASYYVSSNHIEEAIRIVQSAVNLQASFKYIEPENFYLPLRQCLGALYLDLGIKRNDTMYLLKAVDEFAIDLTEHPYNGWSLHGLVKTKKSINKLNSRRSRLLKPQQLEYDLLNDSFSIDWGNLSLDVLETLYRHAKNAWRDNKKIVTSCHELGLK